MQLVAYGAQDVYLTGNPKVTFFQAVYKRHTNFAMENIEQTVNGTATAGGRVSVTVARNGDLISDMYVELTCKTAPTITEDAWIAEAAISTVELSIGGQRIDKHYQKWWRLYAELYMDESAKLNYGKMTSATIDNEKVYLPLIFFFNRNPGLALPLIALQYHEVRIDIDLASTYGLFDSLKVWGNYIYLDTEERRRFAQKGHEYLIEQVQHTGSDSLATAGSTKQIRLSYNHPVKELVWCTTESSNVIGDTNGVWNFTDTSVTVSSAMAAVETLTSRLPQMPRVRQPCMASRNSMKKLRVHSTPSSWSSTVKTDSRNKAVSTLTPSNHSSTTPPPQCQGSTRTPLRSSQKSINQRVPVTSPESTTRKSPFRSRVPRLQETDSTKNTLNMFATNYNVLRIQSGMGGLAFSN